ncbi:MULTISPECIES: hypothetical protein [Eubacteriales]|uniref:Uncharacterized protein n=1 Tax=Bittarella massiliensis (ex Durand et al. 2017) TaxID=1720313 RepID=A0AAQ1MD73_9FIRM|nr:MULTISPECIES: hypothetical protein [Eubacteriales]MZL68892.1 hypothetical protein [Bittarella massiliensis (ex Durand et al. 2017)]MZL80088.1 hypothetical protein [Bittarella massiliensis (ex Durand et al. 2017)]SHG09344.1 hypothetical protein SAMN05444424_1442 [Bittarella massiliensis (ex Durand et al. 2017)]
MNFIDSNYFLSDFLRDKLLKKENQKVLGFISFISQVDSIGDYQSFEIAMKEMEKLYTDKRFIFSVKRAFGESLLYGHLHAIAEYAKLSDEEIRYFPIMEHGVDFWEMVKKPSYPRVFQGKYLRSKWRELNKGVPAFYIGPYIYYAKSTYSKEKICALKRENGKTLLIVPAHTHEMAEQSYDMKKFVNTIMQKYSDHYDTIMVLAYWADLKYDLYSLFQKAGAKLVSAGFRGDPNFISRLKTLLLLADTIVGNDLGTFIGYGFFLGKDVYLIENDVKLNLYDTKLGTDDIVYQNNLQLFLNAFGSEISKGRQAFLCNQFWGNEEIKSPCEVRDIFQVNQCVLKKAKGQINAIPKAVNACIHSDELTHSQRELLLASI